MSERNMQELVVIDPADVFLQKRFSPAQMREALKKLEHQIEEARLIAWMKYVADPKNEEAEQVYVGLCREQGRIMTAFNRWRTAHPEEEE